jgi:hypothetical protein
MRLWAGFALSLAGHLAAAILLWWLAREHYQSETPDMESFIEIDLAPAEEPAPPREPTPPLPIEEAAPEEREASPALIEGPAGAPTAEAALAARPPEGPSPGGLSAPEGTESGGEGGSPGEGGEAASGEGGGITGEGDGTGPRGIKGGLDPRGLSLKDLEAITPGPAWVPGQPAPSFTGAKGAFVMRQLGGSTSLPSPAEIAADNQAPLATAVEPFAEFIADMHSQIHHYWAEGALRDFEQIECGNPVNNRELAVGLEIVLAWDGSLKRAAPVEPSGEVGFDAAAIAAIYDAAPFPAPPKAILSYNDRVYLRWTLYRDERQCGAANASAFLLTGPTSVGAPASQLAASAEAAGGPASEPASAAAEVEAEEVGELAATYKRKAPPKKSPLRAAFSKMFGGCKDVAKDVAKKTLQLIGARHFCKDETPYEAPEAGSADERMGERMGIPVVRRTPPGPLDEISFPACKPGCGNVCLTF